MKFVIVQFLVLTFLVFEKSKEAEGSLIIEIHEIRNAEGQVSLTMFSDPEGFPMKPELAYRHVKVNAAAGVVTVRLDDLPYGKYAIAAMHDENRNDRVDLNFLGIPKEGTGASNDARNLFSGPEFDQAVFDFRPGTEKIVIKMFYRII